MKELLQFLIGGTTDLLEAAKGEAKDAVEALARTVKYIRRWAYFSLASLTVGMLMCWSGAPDTYVHAAIAGSWMFSLIALMAIIWNGGAIGLEMAMATQVGEELFGAKFPDIKPSTVVGIVQRVCGLVAWIMFLHLVAMKLPIEAWRNPKIAIAAFMAISVIFFLALAGKFSGNIGMNLMKFTTVAVLAIFIGGQIPGVDRFGSAVANDAIRKVVRWSAEKELKSLPDDLIGRKSDELASLRKAAIDECGKLACTDEDRSKAVELERDIASLGGGTTAPGEVDEETVSEKSLPSGIEYGDHDLPPPPSLATLSSQ